APPANQLGQWMMQPPQGLTNRELRRWYRDRRDVFKAAIRAGYSVPAPTVEYKIATFRRNLLSYGATSAMLFGINATMRGFPWFIFPTLWMAVSLVRQLGSLWGDGVPFSRIFFGSPHDTVRAMGLPATPAPPRIDPVVPMAPAPVDFSFVP